MQKHKNISIDSLFALITLILVIFLYKNSIILSISLVVLSSLLLMYHHLYLNHRYAWKIFIFTAFFGAIAEIIPIHFGAWSYTLPDFLGIPLWLPLIWAIAGVYLATVAKKWMK